MTDEQLLISLIGTRRARHEQSLREQLGWTDSRFRAALDSLTGRGLIRQEDGGFVRTIPQLSEPAQRILSALPESGARRSGSPLARQLGMQLSDYRDARDELKAHLLVTTGQGRGAGSIARLASDRSHFEERVRGLHEELRIECDVDVPKSILHELQFACYLEPHEGVFPSFGAMITDSLDAFAEEAHILDYRLSGYADRPDDLRKYADGMTAFVARDEGQAALCISPMFAGLERDALEMRADLGVSVVQRTRMGVVRLVMEDGIYIRENGLWTKKTHADEFLDDVAAVLPDDSGRETLSNILSLCLHVLSSNHVGATIVWFFDRESIPKAGRNRIYHLGWEKATTPPELNVNDDQHAPLILHALSQLDRAALLNRDGQVASVGVNLNPAAHANVDGGTRHNSAAGFSQDHDDSLVFVVSADGPVTVFHNGYIVRTTRR